MLSPTPPASSTGASSDRATVSVVRQLEMSHSSSASGVTAAAAATGTVGSGVRRNRLHQIMNEDFSSDAGGEPSSLGDRGTRSGDPVVPVLQNECGGKAAFKPSHLSNVEEAVFRELSIDQILQVVDIMKSGSQPLEAILKSITNQRVQAVQQAISSQYETLDATSKGSATDDAAAAEKSARILDIVGPPGSSPGTMEHILRMARVTPLRLSYDERVFLRLLESTLEVSEYTDKVDIITHWPPAKKMSHEIKQICSILSGLVVAHRYDLGQQLIRERDFKSNAPFFRKIFEIGRRYKILNPERMRDSYGKLLYFLMDSRKLDVVEMLEFDCVCEIQTVERLLARKKNAMNLLRDPLLHVAVAEIPSEGRSREAVQADIRRKGDALTELIRRHCTVGPQQQSKSSSLFSRISMSFFGNRSLEGGYHGDKPGGPDAENMRCGPPDEDDEDDPQELSPDDVEQAIYSLRDHNTFLRFNRDPVERMIEYLRHYFRHDSIEAGFSLAINAGREGARLNHSHERQFIYVLQSLTLWREIMNNMLTLWTLAERDLLDHRNPYRLWDTGQGLNRIQQAPLVSKYMHDTLGAVQQKVGGWCGSSTIHLGDRNVPNALVFIDKYTQVPRILGPVVLCLNKLPELYRLSPQMKAYIDTAFNGPDTARKIVLVDFFRHAFDGAGADNFYDAGSCIDGRLTSAWNWCSQIEKKSYFPLFQLTGFSGFDGRF